jgi:hypothetical protein
MRVSTRVRLLGISLCAAGLLASCAPTRLLADMRAPGYSGGPIKSVLMVVVADDPQARRNFEAAFVWEFLRRGVAAQSALEVLGPDAPTAREAVEPEAKRLGIEAVLLAHLLASKEEQVYSAPIYYDRQFVGGTYVYAYSPTMTGYVLREGYYTTYQFYTVGSALYSAQAGELIWSSRSETQDPRPPERAMADLAKTVADNLKKHALLP